MSSFIYCKLPYRFIKYGVGELKNYEDEFSRYVPIVSSKYSMFIVLWFNVGSPAAGNKSIGAPQSTPAQFQRKLQELHGPSSPADKVQDIVPYFSAKSSRSKLCTDYGVSVLSYLAKDLLVVEEESPDATGAMLYFFIRSIRFFFASI